MPLVADNAYTCDSRIKKFKEDEKERKLAEKKAKEDAARAAAEEKERVSIDTLSECPAFVYMLSMRELKANKPFYRYGGHIELIRFKEFRFPSEFEFPGFYLYCTPTIPTPQHKSEQMVFSTPRNTYFCRGTREAPLSMRWTEIIRHK